MTLISIDRRDHRNRRFNNQNKLTECINIWQKKKTQWKKGDRNLVIGVDETDTNVGTVALWKTLHGLGLEDGGRKRRVTNLLYFIDFCWGVCVREWEERERSESGGVRVEEMGVKRIMIRSERVVWEKGKVEFCNSHQIPHFIILSPMCSSQLYHASIPFFTLE